MIEKVCVTGWRVEIHLKIPLPNEPPPDEDRPDHRPSGPDPTPEPPRPKPPSSDVRLRSDHRAATRGDPAAIDPAPTRACPSRGHLDLSPRDRQRGDHRRRPRPTTTGHPGNRRPAHRSVAQEPRTETLNGNRERADTTGAGSSSSPSTLRAPRRARVYVPFAGPGVAVSGAQRPGSLSSLVCGQCSRRRAVARQCGRAAGRCSAGIGDCRSAPDATPWARVPDQRRSGSVSVGANAEC